MRSKKAKWMIVAATSAALAAPACRRPLPDRPHDPDAAFALPDPIDADPPDPSVEPTPFPVIRFAALGDTGSADQGQLDVAAALRTKCEQDGCDFVVLLGDNVYGTGVSSVDDPLWQLAFEIPYQDIALPFIAVLGNHDYGAHGAGTEFEKGAYQVGYSAANPKFVMPAEFYTLAQGAVEFLALGTNLVQHDHEDALHTQSEFFAAALSSSDRPWRVALGHHPYISNGPHGNAGVYDGVTTPPWSGEYVKTLFDTTLCGQIDIYLSAHDHNRQVFASAPGCDAVFVVSGAGSNPRPFANDQPTLFQADTRGFAYLRVTEAEAEISMIDVAGVTEFSTTISK